MLAVGGLLLRKGVQIIINPANPKCFSLVFKNKALINGVFMDKNLMLVQIIPVSDSCSTVSTNPEAQTTEIDSKLLHHRLGHVSARYLKTMCKQGCADVIQGVVISTDECDVCAVSKGKKLPHRGTRPRAARFLKNIHVDLSRIIRTRGLHD